MKLNEPLWAIVDPRDNRILGDGECPAIYTRRPDKGEIALVRRLSQCPDGKVVRVRIVEERDGE